MKTPMFGVAAVLAAIGAGFCCLGPVILGFLGVSAVASLTTLRYVVPNRNAFLTVTLIALVLACWSAVRRGRSSRTEWAILGASTLAVVTVIAYTISVEGMPQLW